MANEISSLAEESSKTAGEIQKINTFIVDIVDKLAESSFELLNYVKTNVISDYDVLVHTGEEYASDAHNFKNQMEKFGGCIDELQQSMERIHYYVNDIMDGFDKQKEEVVKNSGYMTQIDEEFKKIVDAVLNNKEIVDELETIIITTDHQKRRESIYPQRQVSRGRRLFLSITALFKPGNYDHARQQSSRRL